MTRAEQHRGYAQECRAIANRAEGFEQQIHLCESEMWGGLATDAERSTARTPVAKYSGHVGSRFQPADA